MGLNQRSIDFLSLLHHFFIEMGSKKHPNRPPADPGAPKWVENAPHLSPVGPQAPWDRFVRGKSSPFGVILSSKSSKHMILKWVKINPQQMRKMRPQSSEREPKSSHKSTPNHDQIQWTSGSKNEPKMELKSNGIREVNSFKIVLPSRWEANSVKWHVHENITKSDQNQSPN